MRYFDWIHKRGALRLMAGLESEPPAGTGMTKLEGELAVLGEMLRAARPAEREPSEAAKARISNRILRIHLTHTSEQDPAGSTQRHSGPLGLHPRAVALISAFLVIAFVAGGLLAGALLLHPSGSNQLAWAGELTSMVGKVERCSAGGTWGPAVSGDKLSAGDALRTDAGARAEVLLANGDLFRLNAASELSLESYSDQDVRLRQVAGGSYHRSAHNTSYSIAAGDLDIRANDTAFSLTETPGTGEVQVMCIYSDVQVATQQQSGVVTSSLVEGEKCKVTQSPGAGLQLQVDSMSAQDLNDEWLRWNRDRDLEYALQLGVLARLPLGGLPGGEEAVPGGSEQTGSNSSGTGTAIPGASQSIAFSGAATDDGIQLTWQVHGYDTISAFQIYRSEGDPAGKTTFSLNSISRKSFLDTSALPDRQYRYQLALCDGDTVLALSEVINVGGVATLPTPQLQLDISPGGGGVIVQGSVSGVTGFTSYVLIRSTSRSNPSYPLEAGESAIQFITSEPFLSYWDGQVTPGQSYFYRLMLCEGDRVILRSNTASAVIPVTFGNTP